MEDKEILDELVETELALVDDHGIKHMHKVLSSMHEITVYHEDARGWRVALEDASYDGIGKSCEGGEMINPGALPGKGSFCFRFDRGSKLFVVDKDREPGYNSVGSIGLLISQGTDSFPGAPIEEYAFVSGITKNF